MSFTALAATFATSRTSTRGSCVRSASPWTDLSPVARDLITNLSRIRVRLRLLDVWLAKHRPDYIDAAGNLPRSTLTRSRFRKQRAPLPRESRWKRCCRTVRRDASNAAVWSSCRIEKAESAAKGRVEP